MALPFRLSDFQRECRIAPWYPCCDSFVMNDVVRRMVSVEISKPSRVK
jgi:hypothetical protein